MKRISVALLLALVMAQPAWALTLDEARQSGRVEETLSGYLAACAADHDTLALVAQQNNLTTADVASIAGQKLVSRAAAGEYVRGINGQWQKKE